MNSILPVLVWLYNDIDEGFKIPALNIAVLSGFMIGQVVFGILADKWGRQKIHGWELMITVVSVLGVLTAATGYQGSMSIFGWLFFWRIILVIGVGIEA